MGKVYLIDTDVILQAKNLHYRFEFCNGFWTWLEAAHAAGLVYSVDKVRSEILTGHKNDLARKWVEQLPATFFRADAKDSAVMAHYAQLMAWATGSNHYTPAAVTEFADADRADAFLVACAKDCDAIVVSHEKENAESRRRIPIPNAAAAIGVTSMTIFDLLSIHASTNFSFKP